jgi:hypothetical protein
MKTAFVKGEPKEVTKTVTPKRVVVTLRIKEAEAIMEDLATAEDYFEVSEASVKFIELVTNRIEKAA